MNTFELNTILKDLIERIVAIDDRPITPPITLRQWYAGLAMQCYLTINGEYSSKKIVADCAVWAYEMADAMVKEGEK